MTKKIQVAGGSAGGGVILPGDEALQTYLRKKGVQSLVDSDGFEIIDFEPLVDGGTYTLGPPTIARQQPLRLFELIFRNIPTGSSGTPHIPHELDAFPLDQLRHLPMQLYSTQLCQRHHQEHTLGEGKVYYSRELQVQDHCDKVVMDVIESCQYDLKIET